MRIRIADLFAGIGGIRMGMVQALGDAAHVVYSSEWNKYSVQTYEANWHDEKSGGRRRHQGRRA